MRDIHLLTFASSKTRMIVSSSLTTSNCITLALHSRIWENVGLRFRVPILREDGFLEEVRERLNTLPLGKNK